LLQPETNPATRWTLRDLTVTLNGKLTSVMQTMYPDADLQLMTDTSTLHHGELPLHQFVAPKGSLTAGSKIVADQVTWDPDYAAFTADFVWTDENNNEILRVADVPIDWDQS
jgi:hypothetical protein